MAGMNSQQDAALHLPLLDSYFWQAKPSLCKKFMGVALSQIMLLLFNVGPEDEGLRVIVESDCVS